MTTVYVRTVQYREDNIDETRIFASLDAAKTSIPAEWEQAYPNGSNDREKSILECYYNRDGDEVNRETYYICPYEVLGAD